MPSSAKRKCRRGSANGELRTGFWMPTAMIGERSRPAAVVPMEGPGHHFSRAGRPPQHSGARGGGPSRDDVSSGLVQSAQAVEDAPHLVRVFPGAGHEPEKGVVL